MSVCRKNSKAPGGRWAASGQTVSSPALSTSEERQERNLTPDTTLSHFHFVEQILNRPGLGRSGVVVKITVPVLQVEIKGSTFETRIQKY